MNEREKKETKNQPADIRLPRKINTEFFNDHGAFYLKEFSTFFGVIFGLALLVALLAGGYYLFRYIAGVFARLEPQLATVTAIASVVALLCAVIIAGGLKSRDHKELESGAYVEKAQLYRELLFAACHWEPSEKKDSSRVEVEHIRIKQSLALSGSPEVILTYGQLERLVRQKEFHGDGAKTLFNKLVMEMRKDLGQTELKIQPDDLMNLLIERENIL